MVSYVAERNIFSCCRLHWVLESCMGTRIGPIPIRPHCSCPHPHPDPTNSFSIPTPAPQTLSPSPPYPTVLSLAPRSHPQNRSSNVYYAISHCTTQIMFHLSFSQFCKPQNKQSSLELDKSFQCMEKQQSIN